MIWNISMKNLLFEFACMMLFASVSLHYLLDIDKLDKLKEEVDSSFIQRWNNFYFLVTLSFKENRSCSLTWQHGSPRGQSLLAHTAAQSSDSDGMLLKCPQCHCSRDSPYFHSRNKSFSFMVPKAAVSLYLSTSKHIVLIRYYLRVLTPMSPTRSMNWSKQDKKVRIKIQFFGICAFGM